MEWNVELKWEVCYVAMHAGVQSVLIYSCSAGGKRGNVEDLI